MSQSSAIMDKLAWRAKWRRRWEKWKKAIFIVFLLVVLVPAVLCFTPWAPRMVYTKIVENKLDPITKKLRPEAVENLYKMGVFYSITMREDEALRCWEKLAQWYYGYSILKWASNTLSRKEYRRRKKVRLPFPDPETKSWVGYALYRLAQSRSTHKHKQQAKRIFELYLKDFENKPGEDKKFTTHAHVFIRRYRSGG